MEQENLRVEKIAEASMTVDLNNKKEDKKIDDNSLFQKDLDKYVAIIKARESQEKFVDTLENTYNEYERMNAYSTRLKK